MNARCPECDNGLGERTDTSLADGDVRVDFTCPDCGHEWSLPL